MNKRTLKRLMRGGIDECSINIYGILYTIFKNNANPNDTISVKTFTEVLNELSKEWDKAIDEVIKEASP